MDGNNVNVKDKKTVECLSDSILKESSNKTQELYDYAKTLIPGGTQLLSKRPEMLAPGRWPAYFKEAKGCEIWDLDDKHYYDMSTNGIGSCLLGYRDPDVTKAVINRIELGSMCTLNPPEEVELAEKLCDIHGWADQARFARTGGETASIAIRIARATTNRSKIAMSGYHGWHDWYMAVNLGQTEEQNGKLLSGLPTQGVPGALRNTTIPFVQGDLIKSAHDSVADFDGMMAQHGDDLAAVIMEPCRYIKPEHGYLEYIREETRRRGIILIFDEISIGWRHNFGGSHLVFGVNPDMAIFAKALGNGHPIGAVIGTKEAMDGANDAFISSTYWTESVGPVAALAAIDKFENHGVAEHVNSIGIKVMELWRSLGQKNKLPVTVVDGTPCLAHFEFSHPLHRELNTLFTQLMLDRGFLAGTTIYPTFAHTLDIVDKYGKAVDEVFSEIAMCLEQGKVEERVRGQVAHAGFKRLL